MAVPLRDRLCFLSRVRAVLGRGAAGGEGGAAGGCDVTSPVAMSSPHPSPIPAPGLLCPTAAEPRSWHREAFTGSDVMSPRGA